MATSVKTYVLATNDIIIAKTDGIIHNDHIILELPALLIHQRPSSGPLGFLLQPWIPIELMKDTLVLLDTKKIIAESHLSSTMERFYSNWAQAEVEKITVFAEVFDRQIVEIEKRFLERLQKVKEHQQKMPMAADTPLTDALTELFDSLGNEWGDPTVTH